MLENDLYHYLFFIVKAIACVFSRKCCSRLDLKLPTNYIHVHRGSLPVSASAVFLSQLEGQLVMTFIAVQYMPYSIFKTFQVLLNLELIMQLMILNYVCAYLSCIIYQPRPV